ncbi:MAG: hypothetical protein ACE5ID_02085 [Acidobacteriota bacterium]
MSFWRISMVIAALLAGLGLGTPSSTPTSSTSVAGRFNQGFDVNSNPGDSGNTYHKLECVICR